MGEMVGCGGQYGGEVRVFWCCVMMMDREEKERRGNFDRGKVELREWWGAGSETRWGG